MKTEILNIIKLVPSEGYTLTNKDNSILSKMIYLGCNDSSDNYTEITDLEAAEIEAKLNEEIEKKIKEEENRSEDFVPFEEIKADNQESNLLQ